ncbi:hypothetical protein LUZ60_010715 [Juncus effusus]|nr:hypothetical protein LUZ60_010715 [Juncus effusus]
MSSSRINIGTLIPVTNNNSSNEIRIYEGDNLIGRNNVKIVDKRLSRNHISLHASSNGSIEVLVEGPNPIILSSEGQRRKICSSEKSLIKNGDILELIPGSHLFKYVEIEERNSFQMNKIINSCKKEKRQSESNNDETESKRNKQIIQDEALARELQKMEDGNEALVDFRVSKNSQKIEDGNELNNFRVTKDLIPEIFRLIKVQSLPSSANSSSVTIQDIIEGDVVVAVLSNYMVDLDWLLSACPNLKNIPHVLVVHGESNSSFDHLKYLLKNWVFHKPPLPISYGTHHSKALLLIYPSGIRIAIHTANYIHIDWNNKTQGVWMQDFPFKNVNSSNSNNNFRSPFENDLVEYLASLKWPEFTVNIPNIGNVAFNASFFRKFDYSNAKVRLVGSVPGYHTGTNLTKWGHMKLRKILQESIFDKEFIKSPLIYQFSSLGSLDEKWLTEFQNSLSAGSTEDRCQLGIGQPLIVFPTVEDVRCSIEGYSAGGAIPSPQKNVEKEFLKKYWAKWKADHVGRCRAMPHIKTYTRYNGQNIAWFLLTSANLSKAAWGALQKNNTQLMIRSYEINQKQNW